MYVVWSMSAWSMHLREVGRGRHLDAIHPRLRAGRGVSAVSVVAAFASLSSRSCQVKVTSLDCTFGLFGSVVTGLVSTTWLLSLLNACVAWSSWAQTFGEVQGTTVQ